MNTPLNDRYAGAIENFRAYLQINTAQPSPDYTSAVAFLRRLASSVSEELKVEVREYAPGKPVVLITLVGSAGLSIKSVVLNSHLDVVPAEKDKWLHDPFGAEVVDGRIYARGSQDMKCCGIGYLEAIRALLRVGWKPKRTLHVLFVPDEEIGGETGMKLFVESSWWTSLNVGLVIDEGLAHEEKGKYWAYYGERAAWWIKIEVNGETGHGSQFIADTAGPKMNQILTKLHTFRDEQEKFLTQHPELTLGDVTTVNLTMISGGVQQNVLPSSLELKFDIRISPRIKLDDFRSMLNSWCQSEKGVSWSFIQETPTNFVTKLEGNPWFEAISKAAQTHGTILVPSIFPAATDSRYVRRGPRIPSFGISPIDATPVLLHRHDEYLGVDVFLRGIRFYEILIPLLAEVDAPQADQSELWTVEC